jgi:hypothetical protein
MKHWALVAILLSGPPAVLANSLMGQASIIDGDILIEDEAAAARTIALRTPVDRANQRFGNVCRISATLLAPPSQAASPPLLTVVAAKRSARGGKYG